MECHVCGATVTEGQRFCQDCGQSLHGVTERTERLDTTVPPTPAPEDAAATEPAPTEPATWDAASIDPETAEPELPALGDLPTKEIVPPGPATGGPPQAQPPTSQASPAPGDATVAPPPSAPTDAPTEEIDPRAPLPDPQWAAAPAAAASTELFDDLTTPTPPHPTPVVDASTPRADATTRLDTTPAPGIDAPPPPADATTRLDTTPAPGSAGDVAGVAATTVLEYPAAGTTDELPAVFDGSGDVSDYQPGREPFRLRLIFVLAFFGAVAVLMSAAADITDVRTSTPIDGITIGATTLSDVGVNLPIAGYVGAVVTVLGGLLACYGLRWGAGLAGGGGLALAGWAGLTIGLVEAPIAVAESITRTSSEAFTLTVTRDLGYWLIVAVGAIGLLVFAASLRSAGTGGRRSLNPWVAAVGAVSAVILAAGPLIPVGDEATFADNFRSPNPLIDLPTAYFGGRLGQVALIALAGVVGFLLVRTYGLGLAAGGVSVATWMWLSSLLRIGEDPVTGDQPLGIAAGNFGAVDTTPHAVTTVGMVLTLTMLALAALLATIQYRQDRPSY